MAFRTRAAALFLLGVLLRLVLVVHLGPHIDEPASILAMHQVAETGVPILPSGVLYLQGATLSYLSAPLHWLGLDGPDHLAALRLVPFLAGVAVLGVVLRMVHDTTGDRRLALLALAAVALDPMSAQWSAHLRPYSLLELVSIGIAWSSWRLLQGDGRQRIVLPALFFVGAFSHLLVGLLLPGMLISAAVLLGRGLWTERRDVLATGVACASGPLFVVVLNKLFAVSSAADADGGGALSFIGNHLLSLSGLAQPQIVAWKGILYRYGSIDGYLLLFGILLGVVLATQVQRGLDVRGHWALLGAGGQVIVATLTDATQARYVMHLHVLLLLAVITSVPELRRAGRGVLGAVAVALVWGHIRGLYVTFANPMVSPDYREVHDRLADEIGPDDQVFTPMPAVSWWLMPELRNRLVFLAGAEDSVRPGRYTHPGPNGQLVDFWLGVPSVVSIESYCQLGKNRPWVLYDDRRLHADNAYAGRMRAMLRSTVVVRHSGPGETTLGRVSRFTSWAHRCR